MDLMNLGHGYSYLAQGVSRIECDSLIIGVKQDQLIPCKEQATIVSQSGRYGLCLSAFLGGYTAITRP